MRVKEKFELMYKGDEEVYNVVPIKKSTLSAYQIDKEDAKYLLSLVRTFSRARQFSFSEVVLNKMDKCMVVKIPSYPLPGFVTKEGLNVVNIGVLPATLISDHTPADIYTAFLYTITLGEYFKNKPFTMGNEINISNMFFSIFMKLFGKMAGLIGSFKHLIPRLQYLITLYTYVSFMGVEPTINIKKKIGAMYYVSIEDLKLDYDFLSIIGLLKSINDNDIISLSENKFSTKIIASAGISSLPMFEDISRFYATMLASDIPGNTQFSYFWSKVNTNLFQKINYVALRNLYK